jgi:competence protein ComEC
LTDRFLSILFSIPNLFKSSLNKVLPEPHSSLSSGILLGSKRNIPDSLLLDLQKTGLTHIIALSGFNVTIIIAIFAQLLTVYLGRKRTFILGMILVIIFVLMTGASPSILRAAIFSFLILFGRTIGRAGDQTNLLLLTALLMTLFNPYLLSYDLGFQLSFLAFGGLIYLSPFFEKIFQKPRLNSLPNGIKSSLAQTLSAQLAVAPLIFFKFGLVSLISPLANLLVVGAIPWIMLMTFVTGLLSLIYIPLGKIMIVMLWPMLEYVIKLVEVLANLPFSSLKF